MNKCISVLRTPVLGLGAIFLLGACDPVPSKPLTSEQKRVDMEWMYSQFDENYAPLEYKMRLYGFDYETMKRYYRERAMATRTNDEFYQLMHQFVAEFRDPHTTAALTHGGLKDRAKLAYIGVSGKRQGDVFVVTELLPTYDAKKTNFPIKVGDEISKLDGVPLVSIIRNELVKYENIGHDPANLTFHMNRIFNRVSTTSALPTKADAVVTIVRREYTADEKSEIEEKEDRKLKVDEKKMVNLEVSVPWVIKDLFDFRQDQKLAKAEAVLSDDAAVSDADEGSDSDSEAKKKLNASFDVFSFEAGPGQVSQVFGLKGFDGTLQFPTDLLSKIHRGSKGYHYLNTFYFPNQVESWTTDIELDDDGAVVEKQASVADQLKKSRFVPKGARFITPDDAVFPTYVTSEKIGGNGRNANDTRLVATMYLNTFSPKGKQAAVMKEVKATLDTLQFYGINDIVIDMINNGGGSLSLGMQLAQALSNKKVEMPYMQFVLSQTWLDEFENLSLNAPSDSERELAKRVFKTLYGEYKGGKRLSSPLSTETLVPFELSPNDKLKKDLNIVLLVNEMCASMCDIFTGIMQDNKLATVIGSKTMGAGGNVVAHYSAPNSHLILRQTESLIIRTDAKKSYIENNGIDPDIAVDVNLSASRKYRNVRQVGIKTLMAKSLAPKKPAGATRSSVSQPSKRSGEVEVLTQAGEPMDRDGGMLFEDNRGGKRSRVPRE